MELFYVALGVAVTYLLASIRVLNQYERGVLFVLGKYQETRGPGLSIVPLGWARMKTVSLRIVAIDIPQQDVITRDNISVKVNAVLYMRVAEPSLAVMEIQDYLYATGQLAQTTLLSVLGQVELDELLADRKKVNDLLKEIIDQRTDFWGVEISAVEIKDVLLPESMRRAIGRQAEAERERRAKIINAQGELQASTTLAEAAKMLQSQPASIQLRYLQTVVEIAAENNSTTIFPLPIDILQAFMPRPLAQGQATDAHAPGTNSLPATANSTSLPAPAAPAAPAASPPLPQFKIAPARKPSRK